MKCWLSFDDGARLDMRIAEMLKKYDLTGTFFVPVMWQSHNLLNGIEPLSRDEVQYLADNFELGSHGITHQHLTKIPYAMAEFEITASKRMLQNLFGVPVEKFCYPRGYATDQIRDIVRKNYELARNTLVGSIEESEDPSWQNCTVHAGYDRAEYNDVRWYDVCIEELEKCKRKNGYYVLFAHSWELEKFDGWNGFDRLLGAISEATHS